MYICSSTNTNAIVSTYLNFYFDRKYDVSLLPVLLLLYVYRYIDVHYYYNMDLLRNSNGHQRLAGVGSLGDEPQAIEVHVGPGGYRDHGLST